MIRQILGIIAGYTIFVVTSLALFKITGHKPHSPATNSFIVFTTIYGIVFSLISGFITKLVAKTRNLHVCYILALIIAGFAMFSLLKSDGSHWTQFLAIVIFAPTSILGGLFHSKRSSKLSVTPANK